MNSVTKVDSLADKYMAGGYLDAAVAFEKAMKQVVDSPRSVTSNEDVLAILSELIHHTNSQIASILQNTISQISKPVSHAPTVKSAPEFKSSPSFENSPIVP